MGQGLPNFELNGEIMNQMNIKLIYQVFLVILFLKI